jgi:hypothetical protein
MQLNKRNSLSIQSNYSLLNTLYQYPDMWNNVNQFLLSEHTVKTDIMPFIRAYNSYNIDEYCIQIDLMTCKNIITIHENKNGYYLIINDNFIAINDTLNIFKVVLKTVKYMEIDTFDYNVNYVKEYKNEHFIRIQKLLKKRKLVNVIYSHYIYYKPYSAKKTYQIQDGLITTSIEHI